MKKEQYFHFRRDSEDHQLLVPPSPQADSRGGICIYAHPIEKENIILWGVAKCHENDNYVKSKARTMAKGRAISNYIRKTKGKTEIQNDHCTVSPFMDYEKAVRMAVKIANCLHELGMSSFADIQVDWDLEKIRIGKVDGFSGFDYGDLNF
jgi:hypothetical protein